MPFVILAVSTKNLTIIKIPYGYKEMNLGTYHQFGLLVFGLQQIAL